MQHGDVILSHNSVSNSCWICYFLHILTYRCTHSILFFPRLSNPKFAGCMFLWMWPYYISAPCPLLSLFLCSVLSLISLSCCISSKHIWGPVTRKLLFWLQSWLNSAFSHCPSHEKKRKKREREWSWSHVLGKQNRLLCLSDTCQCLGSRLSPWGKGGRRGGEKKQP